MKSISKILIFLVVFSTVSAGTVRLTNNTGYKLRAIIRAADGTELGGLDIPPQQTMSWNSYLGGVGNIQYYDLSQTPYTVAWFCSEGEQQPFSICTGVSSGSTVAAGSCGGTGSCKPPKKQQQQTQPSSPQQQIQQQTEKEAGPPQGMVQ